MRDDLRSVALVDRMLDPPVGASLQPVGTNDGCAHDALGDLRQQLPDPGPHKVEGLRQPALHGSDDGEERDDQHHNNGRQLPRVQQHERQPANHLGERDDPRDPAPLRELRQRVHVGGDACHEHAALLFRLLGDRKAMDVLERPNAKRHQGLFRSANQPAGRDPAGDVREDHESEGDPADDEDVSRPETAGEPVIEDLLHKDGRDERRDGHAERHDDGESQPGPELGRFMQPASQHRAGALEVRRDLEVLVRVRDPILDHDGAHRSLRSYALIIAA